MLLMVYLTKTIEERRKFNILPNDNSRLAKPLWLIGAQKGIFFCSWWPNVSKNIPPAAVSVYTVYIDGDIHIVLDVFETLAKIKFYQLRCIDKLTGNFYLAGLIVQC